MHRINECISLINDIDEGKELSSFLENNLREWVEINKNITCNKYQVELVRIVENVLSEKRINFHEKNRFLYIAKNHVISFKKEISIICDLKQIISDISFKNDYKYLKKLKTWLSNYISIEEYNDLPEPIYSLVNDIIDNSDKPQNSGLINTLLKEVDKYLNQLRYYSKIHFLKQKVKEKKNIGINLLEILDKKDIIDKIHSDAEIQLNNSLISYSGMLPQDSEIVFISLVLIALFEYDGNFYEGVRKTYKTLYCNYTEQKIEGLIRSILSKYSPNFHDRRNRTRIIRVVLKNAIVPKHYLPDFFEFIYDIYKINLEYDIPDNIYDEFEFAYIGISRLMNYENDSYQENITKKTYKLIKATKSLLLNDRETLIQFSIIVAKLINKKIWGTPVDLYNPYLKYGFEKWSEKLNDDKKIANKNQSFYSNWEPQYQLIGENIYIIPPVHKVKNEFDYKTIKIKIINDNNILYEEDNPDVREIIGGYKVISPKICINHPLGKLEYMVLANEEIIYRSKNKLYRSFIVFDEKCNEIKNNSNYEGNAIFCYEGDYEIFQNYYTTDNYNLAEKKIECSDFIVIGDDIFYFSEMKKLGVLGEYHKNCFVITSDNSKKPVYKKIQYMMFECDYQTKPESVFINEIKHSLSDFDVKIQSKKHINNYLVKLELKRPDIYRIRIPNICAFDIVYDPNLKYVTNKIDENSFETTIQTGLTKQKIDSIFSIDEFKIDKFSFINKGKKYRYYCDFKFDFYRINKSKWRHFSKDIWIDEINQNTCIEIIDQDFNEISIVSDSGQVLGNKVLNDNGIFRNCNIGFIVTFKNSSKYVIFELKKNDITVKKIYCYNQCVINEKQTEIYFNPLSKKLTITSEYYGKGKVFFEILDDENKLVYKSDFIECNEPIDIFELESFKKYTIRFYEQNESEWLKPIKLIKEYNKKFYAYEDLCGRSFKIEKAFYNRTIFNGKFVTIKMELSNVYLFVFKRLSVRRFQGRIYIQLPSGEYMLDNINPVIVDICSDIIDGMIEVYMSNDGDGLLLDVKNKSILNSLTDKKAPDIFTYNIEIESEE